MCVSCLINKTIQTNNINIIIIIILIGIIFISIIAVAWAQKTPPNFPATAKSVAKPFEFCARNSARFYPGGILN